MLYYIVYIFEVCDTVHIHVEDYSSTTLTI